MGDTDNMHVEGEKEYIRNLCYPLKLSTKHKTAQNSSYAQTNMDKLSEYLRRSFRCWYFQMSSEDLKVKSGIVLWKQGVTALQSSYSFCECQLIFPMGCEVGYRNNCFFLNVACPYMLSHDHHQPSLTFPSFKGGVQDK